MDNSTKSSLGNARKDPWKAIEWKACQTVEFFDQFLELIDEHLSFGRHKLGLEAAVIAERLAKRLGEDCAVSKASAYLSSAYRVVGAGDLAAEARDKAASACQCDGCQGELLKRKGVLQLHNSDPSEALRLFSEAGECFLRQGDMQQVYRCRLYKGASLRLLGRIKEGLAEYLAANAMEVFEVPPRFFMMTMANAVSLAAASDSSEDYKTALAIVEDVRKQKIVGNDEVPPVIRCYMRWFRGLLFSKMGDTTSALRCLNSAKNSFVRINRHDELPNINAEIARVRASAPQQSTATKEVVRLIEATLQQTTDEELRQILSTTLEDPTPANLEIWRSVCSSSKVPFDEGVAIESG